MPRHLDLPEDELTLALRAGGPQLRSLHLLRDALPEARAGAGMSTLVIGVGNPDRGDDAAGLEVARRLREAAPRA